MRLQHYNLENFIDFDECTVWTLVCESPRQFSKLTGDLRTLSKGNDGWALYDGKQLDIGKYVTSLVDFYSVSLNDKRAMNILQEQLRQKAYDEEHTVATHRILSQLTKYLNELTESIDYPTSVSDVELSIVLKSVGISFLDESENLYEKLMDYVTLLSRLTTTKVLVCVNLRCYLELESLEKFFLHCEQNDVKLLCIESHYKTKLHCEKILYSDSDTCEFFPDGDFA